MQVDARSCCDGEEMSRARSLPFHFVFILSQVMRLACETIVKNQLLPELESFATLAATNPDQKTIYISHY